MVGDVLAIHAIRVRLTRMAVVAFASSKSWDNTDWVVDARKEDMEADFSHFGHSVKSIISLMQKTTIWALFNDPPSCLLKHLKRACARIAVTYGTV